MHTVHEFRKRDGRYIPFVRLTNGTVVEVAYAPFPGSSEIALKVAEVEMLMEGSRGGAKTTTAIMDFCQHCGEGWGAAWAGIFIRRTHPQLAEVVKLCKEWIPKICPGAEFNSQSSTWHFPAGETLALRHFDQPSDFVDYLGHSYPYILFEELTTWSTPDCYTQMLATSRSTIPGMPRKIRATTNPYGVGRSWVMERFRLPLDAGVILGPVIADSRDERGNLEPPRRVVHSHLGENLLFQAADPDYAQRISASAANESQRAAWLEGSWMIPVGSMFGDIWGGCKKHVVIPNIDRIPFGVRCFRAYDDGSSRPFSLGWWLVANGEDIERSDGSVMSTRRGDLILLCEYYGSTGKINEGLRMRVADIAAHIHRFEEKMGWDGKFKLGVADNSIFSDDGNHPSRAEDFLNAGVNFEPASKGPNSRSLGWDQLRKLMLATVPVDGLREEPGMFICGDRCAAWMKTVPVLPRDEKKIDDVDTDACDHSGDMSRYAVRFDSQPRFSSRRIGV